MKIARLIVVIALLEGAAFAQPGAEDLYTQGQAAYDRADYATAVAKWQAAYDLSKESGLLFNIAQAKRLSDDCIGAITTYRRFVALDAAKASEQHKLASDLTRELEGTCPEPKAVAIQLPAVSRPRNDRVPDEAKSGRTWKIAGIATSGVGVVTLAIGLGLGRHGATIGDEITAACATSCDWEAQKAKDARGRRDVTIGKVLDVAGLAAVAGGAVLYYLGISQEAVAITPASGGGSVLSWSRSW